MTDSPASQDPDPRSGEHDRGDGGNSRLPAATRAQDGQLGDRQAASPGAMGAGATGTGPAASTGDSSAAAAGDEASEAGGTGRDLPAPQWSAEQPAPAPWFLGQPGPAPQGFPPPVQYPPVQYPPMPMPPPPGQPPQYPGQQYPGQQYPNPQYQAPPMPPPTAEQANWPNHAPGTRPEQNPQQPGGQGPAGHGVPHPEQGQPQQQPGDASVHVPGPPRAPGQSPGPALGPDGSPQQPAPWHDPNRHGPPGHPPQRLDPRSPYRPPQPPRPPQQQRGQGPGKRPPLSLRTRWARGLSSGGAICILITLLTGYRDFPDWLIAASAGLLMSLAGLWLGAFAQRDAARNAQRAPEAIASVVWSSISALIALAVVSYSLVFFPQLRQYSDCMRAANTIAGQNACQQQFENALTVLP